MIPLVSFVHEDWVVNGHNSIHYLCISEYQWQTDISIHRLTLSITMKSLSSARSMFLTAKIVATSSASLRVIEFSADYMTRARLQSPRSSGRWSNPSLVSERLVQQNTHVRIYHSKMENCTIVCEKFVQAQTYLPNCVNCGIFGLAVTGSQYTIDSMSRDWNLITRTLSAVSSTHSYSPMWWLSLHVDLGGIARSLLE